jgi:AcrR family transcriptional regulator
MATPLAPKATRKVRKSRRDDILTCFTAKVATDGYDEVSLREIAEELGLSKGTIVHHFRSKDAMLEAVMNDYMHRLLVGLEKIEAEFTTPTERLAAVIYQLMLLQELDRDATVACSREITRFARQEVMRDVRQLRDEYEGILERFLEEGIETGEFGSANYKIVALQIFGACNWSWTWFKPSLEWDGKDIARSLVDTLFGGLASQERILTPADHERIADTVEGMFRAVLVSPPATETAAPAAP